MSTPGQFLANEYTNTLTVVWPLGEQRSKARAARIMLNDGDYWSHIGPDDGGIPAPELLRFCRSMKETGWLRAHTRPPWRCEHGNHWDECEHECPEQECGCEDEGWFCSEGDSDPWIGWQTDMDPNELVPRFCDA